MIIDLSNLENLTDEESKRWHALERKADALESTMADMRSDMGEMENMMDKIVEAANKRALDASLSELAGK